MTRHPMFDSMVLNTDYRIVGDLKVTDKIMNDSFWIGLYPGMGDEAISYMIEKIIEFVKAN
jgi:CDP-6-deoxy-D-xylo-4-hexulose-3-dehydrase